MSFPFYSEKDASVSTPANHDLGRQDRFARDKSQEQTTNEAMKGWCSTEDRQDDDVESAMTEELNSSAMGISEKGWQPKRDALMLKDWGSPRSVEKNLRALERMGSEMSVLSGSGGESDVFEDARRYSMSADQTGKLPSSQYKGVVPQANGRWGSQIYEKHQRVWLGTFDEEEDAAKAYDRAVLKFRGRDTITNFSPARDGDSEARFMREHSKGEIVDMLRNHTFDAEFEHHRKRLKMTAALSVSKNNAGASGLKVSGLRANVCQENQETVYANMNVCQENQETVAEDMGDLPREHLFDKALTPSDVGKLNRLVIPKQYAEKYFPLDSNSSEKGLLLNFDDSTGKVWQFRYSYWNSSQSYVLTKGWSRFVKDKRLETSDIVSFHKGFAQTDQFYISWSRKPLGQPGLGFDPHYQKSKAEVVYPVKRPSFLNLFNSRAFAPVINNAAQWTPIFWPSSSNPARAITQFSSHSSSSSINKIGYVDALRSQCSAANGAIPFYFSALPSNQTVQTRFYGINSDASQPMDLSLNLNKSLNSGDGKANIKPLHPFVKPAEPSTAQELVTPEYKVVSSLDPATKKGVRLFGVTLAEPQRFSAEHHGQLNLFPG